MRFWALHSFLWLISAELASRQSYFITHWSWSLLKGSYGMALHFWSLFVNIILTVKHSDNLGWRVLYMQVVIIVIIPLSEHYPHLFCSRLHWLRETMQEAGGVACLIKCWSRWDTNCLSLFPVCAPHQSYPSLCTPYTSSSAAVPELNTKKGGGESLRVLKCQTICILSTARQNSSAV